MSKRLGRKLKVSSERLRNLSVEELHRAGGGLSGVGTCTCDTAVECDPDPEPTVGKTFSLLTCYTCNGSRTG